MSVAGSGVQAVRALQHEELATALEKAKAEWEEAKAKEIKKVMDEAMAKGHRDEKQLQEDLREKERYDLEREHMTKLADEKKKWEEAAAVKAAEEREMAEAETASKLATQKQALEREKMNDFMAEFSAMEKAAAEDQKTALAEQEEVWKDKVKTAEETLKAAHETKKVAELDKTHQPALKDAEAQGNATAEAEAAKAQLAELADVVDRRKRARLRDMKVFVLDNSLREPSVGATFGHTVEDKVAIMDCVKQVGFTEFVVSAPSRYEQVDDSYCRKLQAEGADPSHLWTFSELADADGQLPPVGLRKTKEFGLRNCVIELDTAEPSVDWGGNADDAAAAAADASADGPVAVPAAIRRHVDRVVVLLRWMREHLGPTSRAMVNLRDLSVGMVAAPRRVLHLVAALAQIPADIRPIGLLFEEPLGEYLPSEVARWTRSIRAAMDRNGWPSLFQTTGEADGVLLIHVHKMWGMADAVNLEALAAGADGMFAGVCEEGAAMGAACTAVALTNLARLGNTDVRTRFRLNKLAEAARKVTEWTTHKPVYQRQLVYGPRAVEAVFAFSGIGGGVRTPCADLDADGVAGGVVDRVELAAALGVEEPPLRLHILSTGEQFGKRLTQCFGSDEAAAHGFGAPELGEALRVQVHKRMTAGNDDEYTSAAGLAALYRETTGKLTPAMEAALTKLLARDGPTAALLAKAEQCFCEAAAAAAAAEAATAATASAAGQTAEGAGAGAGDAGPSLSFEKFYNVYISRHFEEHNTFANLGGPSSGRPERHEVAELVRLQFDVNDDHRVQLSEWRRWCLWALREYGDEVDDVDELTRVVLRHSIIPSYLHAKRNPGAGAAPATRDKSD